MLYIQNNKVKASVYYLQASQYFGQESLMTSNNWLKIVIHAISINQSNQPKLPLMQPDLPTRPWEKLVTDIFEFKGLLITTPDFQSLGYLVTFQLKLYATTSLVY